ncbi:MAG: energy transducer TonB [Thermodesulfobacteriota bacterium]
MSPFADAPCEPSGGFVTIEGYTAEHGRKPLVLAIAVHLVIVLVMLVPASLFDFHTREEVYTVNLFDTMAPGPPAKEAAKPPPAVKKEIPPPPPPEVKKIEPQLVKPPEVVEKMEPVVSTEAESQVPAEVVSLKPRLVKKEVKPKKVEKKDEVKVDQALNRIKNELNRRQAQQKAREMQAEAAAAVDDAVSKIRDSIHAQRQLSSASSAAARSSTSSAAGSGAGGGSGDAKLDAALRLYYVAVSQKIHEHWVLPELQEWKKDLKTVVVVEVRRDGVVTSYEFEQKSGNPFFDQFVEKTLKESLPLPPFPADLEEASLEIGLVFHPSGLQ